MSKQQLHLRQTVGIFLICAIMFPPAITRILLQTSSVDKPNLYGIQLFLFVCAAGLFYIFYKIIADAMDEQIILQKQ